MVNDDNGNLNILITRKNSILNSKETKDGKCKRSIDLQLLVMLSKFVANLASFSRRLFIKFTSFTGRPRRTSITNGRYLK